MWASKKAWAGSTSEKTRAPSGESTGGQEVERSPLGGLCEADGDCEDGLTCGGAPAGQCEKACDVDADCGAGAICTGPLGGEGGTCFIACSVQSACRDDRVCAGGVVPRRFCDVQQSVGGTCSIDTDCQDGLSCPNGSAASGADRQCVKDCTTDAECGDGAVCTTHLGGEGGTCWKACTTAADCRSDLVCAGGVVPRLFCEVQQANGGSCAAVTDCAGGLACIDEPGGTCRFDGCVDDGQCGEAAICTSEAGGVGGDCHPACASDADCRTDRACTGGVSPRLYCEVP